MKKIIFIGLFVLFLNITNPSAAVTSGDYDGGYWIRGVDTSASPDRLRSDYKHYTKEGKGSSVTGTGVYHDGGWKASDVFSYGSQNASSSGTNQAYYDYR